MLLVATFVANAEPAPTTSTSPYVQLGELAGALLQRVAIDPQEPGTLYLDVSGGRIARSSSGGASWDIVQVGALNEYFRAITVHPLISRLVFAFSASDDGLSAGRFYVSTDRGAHWTRTASQPVGDFGEAGDGRGMVIDPRDQTILIADLFEGIFRSTDLGKSWTNTLSGSQADLYGVIADPNRPHTFWTFGTDANGASAAWISRDGGMSWSESVIAPFDPATFTTPTAAAVQPGSGKVLVALNHFDASSSPHGLMASSMDGGSSWNITDPGVPQWNAGRTIAFEPVAPTTVLAANNGGPGALRSIDSGATWAQVEPRNTEAILTFAPWPAGPMSGAVAGGQQDLFSSPDFGATWSQANPSLWAAGALSIVSDDLFRSGLYGSSQGGGLAHSVDGGEHWSDVTPPIRAVFGIAVDPLSPAHPVYAATSLNPSRSAMWRSRDHGLHWTELATFPPDVVPVTLLSDPLKPGRMYVLAEQDAAPIVVRSDDFGEHWTSSALGASGDFGAVLNQPMVVDPSHAGTLYAALYFGGLLKSVDSGATWNSVASLPLKDFGILGLAATSGASGAIFVTTAGSDGSVSLEMSSDGGATWSTASNPSIQQPYQLASAPGGRLFAYQNSYPYGCFDNTVQMSRDGGNTWSGVGAERVLAQMVFGHCATVMPTDDGLYLSDPTGNQLIYGARYGEIEASVGTSRPSAVTRFGTHARASGPAISPPRRSRYTEAGP